jgi:hypothetical protein
VQASCAHHTHTRFRKTRGGHIPRIKHSAQLRIRPLGSEKDQILAKFSSFSGTSRQVFTLRPRNEGCCVVPPRIPLSNMPSGRVLHWLPCGGGSPSVQKPRVTAQGSRKGKNLVFSQRKTAAISDLTVTFGGWCVVRPRIPLSMTPFEGTPTGNRLASVPPD